VSIKNQSTNGHGEWNGRGDVALCGVFLAVILVVGLLERMIPLDFIVPGARLGLSNIIILIVLYLFSFRTTLVIVILKCLLLAAISGGPSALIYSLTGSLLALMIMFALTRVFGDRAGIVGVSVAGAAAHSTGQVAAACIVLETIGLFAYLPWLLIVSLVSGIAVGLIAKQTLPRIKAFRSGRASRGR
jgi:heptaprenyl diphosphate synthase